MVSKVILHIGMHKTGTSSIQSSLMGYDDGSSFYARFPHENHSSGMFTAFDSQPERYHAWVRAGHSPGKVAEIRQGWREMLVRDLTRSDRDTLIISAEDLSPIDDAGKQDLVTFLQQYVSDITVICFVRSPASFSSSAFQQRVQEGQTDFPGIIATNYTPRIEGFARILPDESLIIRAFEPKRFPGGSVVKEFFALCQLDLARLDEKEANESLSAPALKLVYEFNFKNPCFTGDTQLVQARFRMIDAIRDLYKNGPRIDKSLFASRVDLSDVSYLKERWGIDFSADGEIPQTQAADVGDWISEMSDVDLTPLITHMKMLGLPTGPETSQWLTSRLFYHFLSQADALPETNAAETDLLRDVALKSETGARVEKHEAIGLMRMAAQRRPNGAFIVRKLAEWTS